MSNLNEENPYQSPRASGSLPSQSIAFRWRLVPAVLCYFWAGMVGLTTAISLVSATRFPEQRARILIAFMILSAITVTSAFAGRFWWRARWAPALFLSICAFLIMFVADKLNLLG
jgi:hypothetical protein